MPTDKQIEANRRNALLSTGPRTESGKRNSRLNAYQHGLTGHLDVLTGDQKQARDSFIAEMVDALKPADAFERQLAHSIADAHWRINRVAVIENNIFAADAFNQEIDFAAGAPADASNADPELTEVDLALAPAITFGRNPQRFHLLALYEMRLHRKALADLKQLRQLQSAREAEAARLKAAEEKQAADTKARRSAAFHEATFLYSLDEQEGITIDPAGTFHHRNGFVFSNSVIKEGIDYASRLSRAKTYFQSRNYPADLPAAA